MEAVILVDVRINSNAALAAKRVGNFCFYSSEYKKTFVRALIAVLVHNDSLYPINKVNQHKK